jgi:hypothetical protein
MVSRGVRWVGSRGVARRFLRGVARSLVLGVDKEGCVAFVIIISYENKVISIIGFLLIGNLFVIYPVVSVVIINLSGKS